MILEVRNTYRLFSDERPAKFNGMRLNWLWRKFLQTGETCERKSISVQVERHGNSQVLHDQNPKRKMEPSQQK